MATHKSAEKKMRQDIQRREQNRSAMGKLRTMIKKVRALLEKKEVQAAQKLVPETLSLIDRTVSRGIIHKNTGSRYKSNIVKNLNKLIGGKKSG